MSSLGTIELRRTILANGVYHLSRAAAFLWWRKDDWHDLPKIRGDLQKLKDQPDMLTKHFNKALDMIVEIFDDNEQFTQDPSTALKSARLEEEIEKELYSRIAATSRNNTKKAGRAKKSR